MLIRRSGKKQKTKGKFELSNQENIRTLGEKEIYKYFGKCKWTPSISEKTGHHRYEKKIRVPQKNKKISRNQLLQQNSHQRNQNRGSLLVGDSEQFLKWTRDELRQIDNCSRKLMTKPRGHIGGQHVSRKKGRRGLTSIAQMPQNKVG